MLGIVRGEIVLGVVGGGVVLGGEEGSCWEGRRERAGRGGIVLGVVGKGVWEEGSCWKGRRGHAGSGGTRRRNEYTIEGRRRCELLVIQLSHTNDAHHRFEKRRPPLLLQLVSLRLTRSG